MYNPREEEPYSDEPGNYLDVRDPGKYSYEPDEFVEHTSQDCITLIEDFLREERVQRCARWGCTPDEMAEWARILSEG